MGSHPWCCSVFVSIVSDGALTLCTVTTRNTVVTARPLRKIHGPLNCTTVHLSPILTSVSSHSLPMLLVFLLLTNASRASMRAALASPELRMGSLYMLVMNEVNQTVF